MLVRLVHRVQASKRFHLLQRPYNYCFVATKERQGSFWFFTTTKRFCYVFAFSYDAPLFVVRQLKRGSITDKEKKKKIKGITESVNTIEEDMTKDINRTEGGTTRVSDQVKRGAPSSPHLPACSQRCVYIPGPQLPGRRLAQFERWIKSLDRG